MASLDVAGVSLERELGRVDADDREPVCTVARVPSLDARERAYAVDAGVGPEIDQHDPPPQLPDGKLSSSRVEPALGVLELGSLAQDGQPEGRASV